MSKKIVLAGIAALTVLGVGPAAFVLMLVLFAAGGGAAAAACAPVAGGAGLVVLDAGGPVRVPLVGRFVVMSEFNPARRDPVDGRVRAHKGIDLASIPAGGDVVAMKAGVITYVGPEPWGALTVEINHGGGFTSRYLHLARWTVQQGQHVAAGQRIGIEGSTGHSTGPHLHWEIRAGGKLVNPRDWATAHGLRLPPTDGTGTAPAQTPPVAPPAASTTNGVPPSLPARVGTWRRPQLQVAAGIIRAGQARHLDDWTLTVGVMTSMAESSLRPLAHGDAVRRDTVGPFQQGPEWGPLAVRLDPHGSAGLFFDALTKIPGYRQLAPTIAAHRTQRNTDPFAYAPYWADAGAVVAALKGASQDTAGVLGADPAAAACPTDPTPNGAASPAGDGSFGSTVPTMPGAPASACAPTRLPAEKQATAPARRVIRCTVAAFPGIDPTATATRPDTIDVPIPIFRTPTGRQSGWVVARWLQANANSLGVQTVIYDTRIWTADRAAEGWRPYRPLGWAIDDTIAHRDHVEARTR
ncbi:peptidoglycan DD-metalloendopeptidase family protein [Intrasporangium sp.]|uniref:M23 family metallopeptidase n=1 Tax=Intrasporangium sp. TaxID=1925024 RepID=UPI00322176B1